MGVTQAKPAARMTARTLQFLHAGGFNIIMRLPRVARVSRLFQQQSTSSSPGRQRLDALESEVRELRPRRLPSEPPAPMPIDRSRRALLLLAEMVRHYVSLGEHDAARRAIGDATVLENEVHDPDTLALAAIHIGEALLALDSPQHAQPRFARAYAFYERARDRRWAARARFGLGRALVALDDPMGIDVLVEARQLCASAGDTTMLAHIDVAIGAATEMHDGRAGYGRPVSVAPPPSSR
jgi:hypothetical protein